MEDEPVPVIEPDSVDALQPGHSGYQIRAGGFQHQVVMIAHEAIGLDLPVGLLRGLGQSFEEIVPVDIIQKNVPLGGIAENSA